MNCSWTKIFTATIGELEEMVKDHPSGTDESIYIQALISYLKGDSESLNKLASENEDLANRDLVILLKLRSGIRNKSFTRESLIQFEAQFAPQVSGLWRGEFCFSFAFAWSTIRDHEKALEYFYFSFVAFMQQEVYSKALKAYMNAIAAHENINPKHLSLANFIYFIKISKNVNVLDALGMAHLNMSYQYQRLGCIQTSLKYVSIAIDYFKLDKNSLHYFVSSAQKLDLLCTLDKGNLEIPSLFNLLKENARPEVIELVKYLKDRYPRTLGSLDPNNIGEKITRENLPLAWQIRLKNFSYGESKFSSTEESLIEFLSSGQKNISEIVSQLNEDSKNDYKMLEASARSLIHRINQKKKGLISKNKTGVFALSNNKLFDEIVMSNKFLQKL